MSVTADSGVGQWPLRPDGREEDLFRVGFRGARESGYDGWADDHSDKSESDKQIMHWVILLYGGSLELVHTMMMP